MEYNIEDDKVIGLINREKSSKCAEIKAIALLKPDGYTYNLSESESISFFPPKGCIFEPGFFYNHKFNVNDIVDFYADENESSGEGKDLYRLLEGTTVRRFGFNVRKIRGFSKKDLVTDLTNVIIDGDNSDGDFFGITDKYLIGKLRLKEGIVKPALYNSVKIWDIDEQPFIGNKDFLCLNELPQGDYVVLDCMDNKKLFEWFRKNLQKIDPDYVKVLDVKAKWRDELPKLISQASKASSEVEMLRLDRMKEAIKFISLSFNDIKMLIDQSEHLKTIFIATINSHKEEFKVEYQKELDLFLRKIETQKVQLKSDTQNNLREFTEEVEIEKELIQEEIELFTKKKVAKKKELQIIIEDLKEGNDQIKRISKDKDRILSDFSIIKDVLSLNQSNYNVMSKPDDSFIVESFDRGSEMVPFINSSEFSASLKYCLSKHHLFTNYSKRMIDIVSSSKAIILKDIRLGLSFAEATRNANYIIQQVEPDWLHFQDFWMNGLGEIWRSAHNNPNKLHFLFLQDLNLSSPECYARPLLDMISGIRKRIPFGNSSYPDNLKIMATRLPSENPEVGLPVYEQTFSDWANLGYLVDIHRKSDENYEFTNGYLTVSMLDQFKPNELDLELIQSINLEKNLVFDEA